MMKRQPYCGTKFSRLPVMGALVGSVLLALSGCGGNAGGTPSGISGALSGVNLRLNTLNLGVSSSTTDVVGTIPADAGAVSMRITLLGAAYDGGNVVQKFNFPSATSKGDGVLLYEYKGANGSLLTEPNPRDAKTPIPILFVVGSTGALVATDSIKGTPYTNANVKGGGTLLASDAAAVPLVNSSGQATASSYSTNSSYILRKTVCNVLVQYYINDKSNQEPDNNGLSAGQPGYVDPALRTTLVMSVSIDPFTGQFLDLSDPKISLLDAVQVNSPVVTPTIALNQIPAGAKYVEYVVMDVPPQTVAPVPSLVFSSGLVPVSDLATKGISTQIVNRSLPLQSALFAYFSNGGTSGTTTKRTSFAYDIATGAFSASAFSQTATDLTLQGSTWTDALTSVGAAFTFVYPGPPSTSTTGTIGDGQSFTIQSSATINTYFPQANAKNSGFAPATGVKLQIPNDALTFSTTGTDVLGLAAGSPGVLTANLAADHTTAVTEPLTIKYGTTVVGTPSISVIPKVATQSLTAKVSGVPLGTQSLKVVVTENGTNGVSYTTIQPVNQTSFTVKIADRTNSYTAQAFAYAGANASGGLLASGSYATTVQTSGGTDFSSIDLSASQYSNVVSASFDNASVSVFSTQPVALRPKLNLADGTSIFIDPQYVTFTGANSTYLSLNSTTGTITSSLGATLSATGTTASWTVTYSGATNQAANPNNVVTATAMPTGAAHKSSWALSNVPVGAHSEVIQISGTDPQTGQSLSYQVSTDNGTADLYLGVFTQGSTTSTFTGTVKAYSGTGGTGVEVGTANIASFQFSGDTYTGSAAIVSEVSGISIPMVTCNDGGTATFQVNGIGVGGGTFPLLNTDVTWSDPPTVSSHVSSVGIKGTYSPILTAGFKAATGQTVQVGVTYTSGSTVRNTNALMNVMPVSGTATGNVG